jgi:hypothetical protein
VKAETSQLKREKLHTHSTGRSFLHEGEVMTGEMKILPEADTTSVPKIPNFRAPERPTANYLNFSEIFGRFVSDGFGFSLHLT